MPNKNTLQYTTVIFMFFLISGVSSGSSQDISSCLCAMLQKTNQNNSIDRIREDYAFELSELQSNPEALAPYLQRFVKNGVAGTCSSSAASWSGSNVSLSNVITNLGNRVPSAKYDECLSNADNNFYDELLGKDSIQRNMLKDAKITSNAFPKSSRNTEFLAQSLFINDIEIGPIEKAHQIFATDLIQTHLFFNNAGATLPKDSIIRLTPWAFPQWPLGMTTQEMTMDVFLEMINPKSYSFVDYVLDIEENQSSIDDIVGMSNWRVYPSHAWQNSAIYNNDIVSNLNQVMENTSSKNSVESPKLFDDFERAQNLLCGQKPSLEIFSESKKIATDIFEHQAFQFTRDMEDFWDTDIGFSYETDYRDCLKQCGDPLLNFGPNCVTDCMTPPEISEHNDLIRKSGSEGVCDNTHAAYRDACIRNLVAEREREHVKCELRWGINPNAPDHLNFGVLSGIQDCQAFSEITAYNCRKYFEERSGAANTVTKPSDILKQCIARYCGAYNLDQEQTSEESDDASTKNQDREAIIEKQIELSKKEREEIVLPAIQEVAKELEGEYKITLGRSQPREGTAFPSRSHLFGGAQDFSISRVDGAPPSPEDYEVISGGIAKLLPAGFQVITELKLVDSIPNGITVKSTTPTHVTFSYTPLLGIESDAPTITVSTEEFGVRYLHSGKFKNSNDGVIEFFRHGPASGNHIHVGRPSGSLPRF